MALLVALVLLLAGAASSDVAEDRKECANTLVGLATCLTYVEGTSAAPTPDCCKGLKGVLAKSPKCLCVLIKDRNDPSLGINLNLPRAVALPDTCKVAANVSHCPELLKLAPNSPEARVFSNLTAGSAATGSSATDKGSGSSSVHESSNGAPLYNYHFVGGRRLLGVALSSVAISFLAMVLTS